jgi:hypothetical protein
MRRNSLLSVHYNTEDIFFRKVKEVGYMFKEPPWFQVVTDEMRNSGSSRDWRGRHTLDPTKLPDAWSLCYATAARSLWTFQQAYGTLEQGFYTILPTMPMARGDGPPARILGINMRERIELGEIEQEQTDYIGRSIYLRDGTSLNFRWDFLSSARLSSAQLKFMGSIFYAHWEVSNAGGCDPLAMVTAIILHGLAGVVRPHTDEEERKYMESIELLGHVEPIVVPGPPRADHSSLSGLTNTNNCEEEVDECATAND